MCIAPGHAHWGWKSSSLVYPGNAFLWILSSYWSRKGEEMARDCDGMWFDSLTHLDSLSKVQLGNLRLLFGLYNTIRRIALMVVLHASGMHAIPCSQHSGTFRTIFVQSKGLTDSFCTLRKSVPIQKTAGVLLVDRDCWLVLEARQIARRSSKPFEPSRENANLWRLFCALSTLAPFHFCQL